MATPVLKSNILINQIDGEPNRQSFWIYLKSLITPFYLNIQDIAVIQLFNRH